MTGRTLIRILAILAALALLALLTPSTMPLALGEESPAAACREIGGYILE